MGKRGRRKSGVSTENPSTVEAACTHNTPIKDGTEMEADTNLESLLDDLSTEEDQFSNNLTSSEGANMTHVSHDEESLVANELDFDNIAGNQDVNMNQILVQEGNGAEKSSASNTNAHSRKMMDWDNEDEGTSPQSKFYSFKLNPCKISPATPAQIIFYTGHTEAGFTHTYEFESKYDTKRTYFCLEDDCPLCCAQIPRHPRIYHPVYNIMKHKMEVLQYMQFNDNKGLYPQIKSIFKRANFPLTLIIHSCGEYKYEVEPRVLPDKLREAGLGQHEQFMKHLLDNNINLESIHNEVNAELIYDSKMQRLLEFHGYDPNSFIKPTCYVLHDYTPELDLDKYTR